MKEVKINDLLNNIKKYTTGCLDQVEQAYNYAEYLHQGQYRQSGEPYISHPLNVAYILSELHPDIDTICASLLHDTLEDTPTKKEDIASLFNKDVANLVDGVTKISKLNFSSKQEQNMANIRKIITSIETDIRVILIKLADRLHNMRTLQYKSEMKQKENSMETLEIFAPLAYYIGAYRIKSELEDLSLRYLSPDEYKKIENIKLQIEEENGHCLQEMLHTINQILSNQKIPHEIKIRTKNIYGIYKSLEKRHKLSKIHDLLALKIMVDTIPNCYQTLGIVHSKYHPLNDKFKDYIYNPKTNMYQSLHTTVFGEDARIVQTQIRTFDMDKVASFGIATYWDIHKGNARNIMQEELKNKFQFYKSLTEIDQMFRDNTEFVQQVKRELLTEKIYVYTPKGDIIELPAGSTAIDFAYNLHPRLGNTMTSAIINDKAVSPDQVLHNKDRVKIVTDLLSYGPREEWLQTAQTTRAKRKIKEFTQNIS